MQNQIALSLLSTPTLGDNVRQAENDSFLLKISHNTVTVTTTTNYGIGIGFLRLQNSYPICHPRTPPWLLMLTIPTAETNHPILAVWTGKVQTKTLWWSYGLGFVDGWPLHFTLRPSREWPLCMCWSPNSACLPNCRTTSYPETTEV